MQPIFCLCQLNVEEGKESNCLFVTPAKPKGALDCCRRSASLRQREIKEKSKKRGHFFRAALNYLNACNKLQVHGIRTFSDPLRHLSRLTLG